MIPIVMFLAGAFFSSPVALSETIADETVQNPETLAEYVREYYADTPILADIAWCESSMRHFNKEGEILRGVADSDDLGVMQINRRYHEKDAVELGFDIYSLNGNLAYAKHLYEKQGTRPWKASSPCWGKIAKG
ncbi:hypothetical protein COU15_00135 [Candidatus Kaiserbacteria bacterium CG10_big_fil_rev_8_21_14_0_10_45_20]|uniref:Transglycosylase SLT domain-containing protein n=1 Tax=Candidatus Kaiserbacteria bacterium CG10_big_fil_rev_8_21_14_0_10_45_20 TaxID=1974607 RepID=A0A2H0UGK2_9BACT|nr:MAG: hypothetical protein COU15_00135 [Candidatus Kaiserbacteria bacterium CG10_big_fil_rev_8_21_14_0_10_45_20]